jgi:hypothetical protein
VTPIMAGLPRHASAVLKGAAPSLDPGINAGVYFAEHDTVVRSDSCASWLQVSGGSGAQLQSAYRPPLTQILCTESKLIDHAIPVDVAAAVVL